MLTSHVASADRNCFDQNLFTDIRARYQSIVEDLLAIENPNDANLRTFQARHESGAFFCRYPNCPRSTIGFDSVELRKHHEDGHAPRFRCIDAACGFNGWTFKNREALDKHTSCYHEEEKIISIPESLGAWPRHSRRDRPLFRLNDPSSGRHRTSDRVEGLSDETESPGSQRGKLQGSSYSGRTLPQRMSDVSDQEINAQGFSFTNSSADALLRLSFAPFSEFTSSDNWENGLQDDYMQQSRSQDSCVQSGSDQVLDNFPSSSQGLYNGDPDQFVEDYSQWQGRSPSETYQQSNHEPQSGGIQAGRGIDLLTPDSRDFHIGVDRLPPIRDALADYHRRLTLTEIQNKKRLLMAQPDQEATDGMLDSHGTPRSQPVGPEKHPEAASPPVAPRMKPRELHDGRPTSPN